MYFINSCLITYIIIILNKNHEQQSGFNIVDLIEIQQNQYQHKFQLNFRTKPLKTFGKLSKAYIKQLQWYLSTYTFTAIIGPSGCGKTTLLNTLSGRLFSKNLSITGQLFVNSKQIDGFDQNIHKIGYVMQQDVLMATFSPRQIFTFTANLKLSHFSAEKKIQRVQELINILNLKNCADTYIGNNLIKGASGGEKKRTSIGVEILTDPSLLFLDQPTTGLDSQTAFNVISFLNKYAKMGKTIISTIHQPSTQIFNSFDRLIIMVEGSIIYQGNAKQSVKYFKNLDMAVPLHTNPIDHYLKLLNKQGIMIQYMKQKRKYVDSDISAEFSMRIQYLKQKYELANTNLECKYFNEINQLQSRETVPFFTQFYYLFVRAFKNEIRNPLDVKLRIFQQILFALFSVILYYDKGDDYYSNLQNVTGCIFFFLTSAVIGGIFSNLNTFNTQKQIFVRQRVSGTYSTAAYYWARSFAIIPFQLFMPFLFISIAYFLCNLQNDPTTFFWSILIIQLVFWSASGFGLLLSTLVSIEVGMSLLPVYFAPLTALAGYFININQVPKLFYPLQYVNFFKFGYQAFIQNQFRNLTDCGPILGQCDILTIHFKFPESFTLNLILLFIEGLILRLVALIMMYVLSNPKKLVIQSKEEILNNSIKNDSRMDLVVYPLDD